MDTIRRLKPYLSSSSEEDGSDNEFPPRRNKTFRPRINFENFTGFEFKERFRVHSEEFEFILEKLGEHLVYPTANNNALTPSQQLLTTLNWLGNGAQYHITSDAHGLSKATVCRVVHRVVNALVDHLFMDIVKWPDDTSTLADKFMTFGGFPSVCGIADGTLIQIDRPNENEAVFVDRDGNHSINALGVCGPDLTFYFVSARWPGAVNDSRVIRNSKLAERMESGWRPFPNAVLLGDSGYGLKEWLIPPLNDNPGNPAERRFNVALKSTRRLIECAFGVLKERFPCLNYLRVQPEFAGKIFMACSVVHNVASKEDYDWGKYMTDQFDTLPPQVNQTNAAVTAAAQARLRDLLDYFA